MHACYTRKHNYSLLDKVTAFITPPLSRKEYPHVQFVVPQQPLDLMSQDSVRKFAEEVPYA